VEFQNAQLHWKLRQLRRHPPGAVSSGKVCHNTAIGAFALFRWRRDLLDHADPVVSGDIASLSVTATPTPSALARDQPNSWHLPLGLRNMRPSVGAIT
jgi:hypothetical protein